MEKWRCKICGYTTEEITSYEEVEEPPEKCPVCGAEKEDFEKIKDID